MVSLIKIVILVYGDELMIVHENGKYDDDYKCNNHVGRNGLKRGN
jgi:hypothetical protein